MPPLPGTARARSAHDHECKPRSAATAAAVRCRVDPTRRTVDPRPLAVLAAVRHWKWCKHRLPARLALGRWAMFADAEPS
jgi:hypothetical protein